MININMPSIYFPYGAHEIEWLARRDSRLGKIIKDVGLIKRKITPGLFPGLVHAISGQQISSKAHATIWNKISSFYTPLTPEKIINSPREQLCACGLSMRKQEYILSIAHKIIMGDMNNLERLSDNEVTRHLIQLRGIGAWTADMLLIFTFKRKNILSFNDLAIQRGLKILYDKEKIEIDDFRAYHKKYSPYATVASFYLWHIANNKA